MSQTVPSADPLARREAFAGVKGKNVLVTGGTSGIGQAIAVRFAEHGANVAINYLHHPRRGGRDRGAGACLRAARSSSTGVRDVLVQGDVSDEDDVVRMVGEAAERLGGIDVLVNNAGIQISRPSDELASARLRQGAGGQPARRVPVRARGDQAIPGRADAGRHRSTSRASTS